MTKPLWSHVLAFSAWILKKAYIYIYSQLPGTLSPDYKYLHARLIPRQLSCPSQTIPNCIRYIIVWFNIFHGELKSSYRSSINLAFSRSCLGATKCF